MAPRKLSDSDKRQITSIYCQPGETTSTLANKFDISSSTVSRVLKQMLPDEEYAKLMKWKRSGERGSFPLADSDVVEQLEVEMPTGPDEDEETASASAVDTASPESERESAESAEESQSSAQEVSSRRSRRRSTADADDEPDDTAADQPEEADEIAAKESGKPSEEAEKQSSKPKPVLKQRSQPEAQPTDADDDNDDDDNDDGEVAAWVAEGLEDAADYDADSDEDWDDEDWDDESDDDEVAPQSAPRETELTIRSFADFSLTKACYLVVDRTAELVTCPLKDFSELGVIPPGEEQARTLPVFDNHKIARRFARRNQRIIKVPDGVMLNKTQDYLQAKGITRILFDGQVYALSH